MYLNTAFPKSNFIKLNMVDFARSIETISDSKQLNVILHILNNINYDNQYIGTMTDTQKSIGEKSKISYETIKNTFKKLCKSDFMRKMQDGVYMVNPFLLTKGPQIQFVKMLQKYNNLSVRTDSSSNTKLFSGKADVYAKARPGYMQEVMDYIATLVPPNAVFADIGAGTGKFTELLAKTGNQVFAVEPNDDMREQLTVTLADYSNVQIISAPAENTTLPDNCVDVVTCAQALHWFEPDKFRAECRRIGKSNVLVIAVYNNTPGGSSISHSKLSTDVFFSTPTVREFDNPQFYTRESWVQYMCSHSHDPLPSDPNYTAHIGEVNDIFDRESVDGVLKRDVVTRVYHEIL
jgi:ubiquinone/menaquinone biosynthesis C-methylase UbiE